MLELIAVPVGEEVSVVVEEEVETTETDCDKEASFPSSKPKYFCRASWSFFGPRR